MYNMLPELGDDMPAGILSLVAKLRSVQPERPSLTLKM
jgi:hypothetical protein